VTLLLIILYPIAVQYERGGLWRLLAPVTLFTLAIYVIATHSELALICGWPRKGEWTFSTCLLRLRYRGDLVGKLCRVVIRYLNFGAPNGRHV
jgi:hypothetical protein